MFEGGLSNQFAAVFNGGGFKGKTSISEMSNLTAEMFNKQMKINSNSISEYSTSQIKAKSAALGLTDALTRETLAMANDADFTAKAATGKLTFGKALVDNIDNIEEIGDALIKSDLLSEVQRTHIYSGKKESADEYKRRVSAIIEGNKEIANSFIDLGDAAKDSTATIGTTFKGLGASLKTFFTSPAGIVTALTAAFAAFVTYMNYAGHSFSRLQEDFGVKASNYQNTKSEVESLNSELQSTKNRIDELNNLSEQNGGLSIVEQAELDTLTQTNDQLERQLQIKENLLKFQAQAQADAAVKASKEKVSDTEYMEDTAGMSGWVYNATKWIGKIFSGGTTPFSSFSESFNEIDSTTEGMLDKSIHQSKQLQTELSALQKDYVDALSSGDEKRVEKIQEDINKTSKAYETATTNIGKYSDTISGWIDAATDEFGNAQFGTVDQVRNWKNALLEVQNMGKTEAQILENNLKSYFDGSDKNYVSKQLKAMAEEGTLTADSVKELGLNLSDAGVKAQDVADYFNQMASAAKSATEESNELSNGLTTEDIEKAFESENAGDNYVKLYDQVQKAQKLAEQGLTGTDEFKSVGEFLSYDKSNGNIDAFYRDAEKIKRYFTEDADGNLTGAGINNFLTDLQNLNKGYASWDENAQKWNFNMDNSAQAAKDLGISVQSMEAILGRIKDYDNSGDFNFHSALEDFGKAEIALSKMQEIYDSMKAGNKKDEFGKELEAWQNQLDTYENDLASLDDNFVVHMELEYDLASIQQDIDEMNSVINEKGEKNASVDQLAERNAAQSTWLQTAEGQLGLNNEAVQLPVQYTNIDAETEKIRDSLSSLSGQDLIDAQIKISNLQEIQQDLIKAFMDEHPEINVESNVDDINKAWESFIDSTEGKEIIARVSADTSDAERKIDTIRQEEVEDKIVNLVGQDDATYIMFMWNELQADPKFTALSASDQATFLIDLWNSFTPEQKQAVMTTTMEATDNASPTVEGVDSKVNALNLDPNVSISATDSASGTISSVAANLASLDGSTAHTYIVTHKSETGDGAVSGTAHYSGTAGSNNKHSGRAFASGTIQDLSWLKPGWKTKKGEVALTGEEDRELVVDTRTNKWWTVGDKGAGFAYIPPKSVVFDAKQTKQLLTQGHINSRGTAHLSGTAYAGGASGSFNFSGGASVYNPPSSGYAPTYDLAPIQEAAQTVETAAESTGDALKELTDNIDHVSTKLDRLERATERAEKSIDRAIGVANKENENSKALKAIQDEIAGNKKAYETYINKAQEFARDSGLSEDLQSKIQTGAFEINHYDDDTKTKINQYKEYYEAALDAQDKILDLQDKEVELAKERLEYIKDFNDAVVDLKSSMIDLNDARLELNDAVGNSAVSNEVKKILSDSVARQEETYNQAVRQLSDYQNEFNNLVKSGIIKEGSDDWYKAQQQITEFTKQVTESNIALIELQEKIREIDYQKIQNAIDATGRAIDRLQNGIDLKEARDQTVNRTDYQRQINLQSQSLQYNYAQRKKKLAKQATETVGSKNYNDLAEEIAKLDDEIYSSLTEIEELRNKVFESEFFNFDKDMQNMQDFRGEIDAFRGFLNEDAFFEKDSGAMTDEAYTNIALIGQGMATAKKEIANYTEGIKKLDKMLKSGLITQKEYDEKQKDMLEGIRDSAGAVHDYRNELLDLYETQMRKENDAMKENINLRKEALSNQKKYWDYADNVKSKSKDVDALNAQIAALEGVTNASAVATRKRLMSQRDDAQKELDNTKRDHQYDMMQSGYDKMSDNLDKSLEDTLYEVASNADKQEKAIGDMLDRVYGKYKDIYGKIGDMISNMGIVGSKDFNSTVSNIGSQSGITNIISGATQDQSSVKPNNSATNINPNNTTNSNHSSIESEISKSPNTTNRPVAEIILSPTSISMEEGKQSKVTATVKPTDAKNKTLKWVSTNTKIATVSNGVIKGIKPGSCQISAMASDGSGTQSKKVAVTITKKPDPPKPKPTPKPQENKTSSDGIPRVGDKVTLKSGQSYYYDSWGVSPAGNLYSGVENGVIIDGYSGAEYGGQSTFHGDFGVHIKGADGKFGDLGWVRLDQLEGYASGTKYVDKDKLAWTQENGSEIVIKPNGSMLTPLPKGSAVLNHGLTENIWKMAENADSIINATNLGLNFDSLSSSLNGINHDRSKVENNFDSIINVEGDLNKDILPELERMVDRMIPHISDKLGAFWMKEKRKI